MHLILITISSLTLTLAFSKVFNAVCEGIHLIQVTKYLYNQNVNFHICLRMKGFLFFSFIKLNVKKKSTVALVTNLG